jgi:hypothetical protein
MFNHSDLIRPSVTVCNYGGKLILDGQFLDGNAYSIIGFIGEKLRRAGNSQEVIDCYMKEAKKSDYEYLKAVSFSCIDLEYVNKFDE